MRGETAGFGGIASITASLCVPSLLNAGGSEAVFGTFAVFSGVAIIGALLLWPQLPGSTASHEDPDGPSGCGRTGAGYAAHRRAAESTKLDFAFSQQRIHSLLEADRALPVSIRNGHQPPRTEGHRRAPRS